MPEGDFHHSPMLLVSYPVYSTGKKPFRYFAMWKSTPSFENLVATHWNERIEGTPMFSVTQKLKKVKDAITLLNKEGFLKS